MNYKKSSQNINDDEDLQIVSGSFDEGNSAADLVRQKVAKIYEEEPSAKEEIKEVTDSTSGLSKHQIFMQNLNSSGKDLATIQTEWHNYYTELPAEEKHQVWQEFYASREEINKPSVTSPALQDSQALSTHKNRLSNSTRHKALDKDSRKTKDIQAAIRNKIMSGHKLTAKQHVQSLLFGLGMGFVVVFIFMFGFFNEIIIAPFIEPSRVSADTPIILSTDGVAPTSTPEVIIPKLNIQIPVDYSETSTDESTIENDLEDGVVHYPTTVLPGQDGNAAFFGHSSNNIFNQGKYKFAFVLLHTLVKGDTFYLTYNDKVYVYKVISKQVVPPSDVGVLASIPGQTATASLITCDPPGTSINRLVVVGQQISPDPSTNTNPVAAATGSSSSTTTPTVLPGNGPTAWTRFIGSWIGKLLITAIILAIIAFTARKMVQRPKFA